MANNETVDDEALDENQEQENQRRQEQNGSRNPINRAAVAAQNLADNANKATHKLGSTAGKMREKAEQKRQMASSAGNAQKSQKLAQQATKLEQRAGKLEKAAKKTEKVAKKAEKFSKLALKLMKIIGFIGFWLLIIMIIIGLLVFIITGWGMLLSGFKQIAQGFLDTCEAVWAGKQTVVHDDEIINVMDNVQQMGYDLYGYGFVSSKKGAPYKDGNYQFYTQEDDGQKSLIEELEDNEAYRNITTYLVSDNYAYCIKNSNRNFKQAFSSIGNFFTGLFDRTAWGNGLISIYHQAELPDGSTNNKITGIAGNSYGGLKDLTSSVKVNRSAKTLDISASGFGSNQTFSYKLDGWTGRYSMPLEFLLATHIATMAPDLSYKLATSFDTDVEILLATTKGNSTQGGVKLQDGSVITYNDFAAETHTPLDVFQDRWLDWDWMAQNSITQAASYRIISAHPGLINNSEEYKCENKNGPCSAENPYGTDLAGQNIVCDNCQQYLQTISMALGAMTEDSFSTFVPYINCVTGHWYRNVYFTYHALNEHEKDGEYVLNNTGYESKTGERWTLYEQDREDNSKDELYVYLPKEDGNYPAEEFEKKQGKYLLCREVKEGEGTYALSTDGSNLYVKKANGNYQLYLLADEDSTDPDTRYQEYTNDSIEEFKVSRKAKTAKKDAGWNAYDSNVNTSATAWTELDLTGASEKLTKVAEMGLTPVYEATKGSVSQTDDGVRGPTNNIIKKLFLDDYYLYDGSGARAALIEKAKEMVREKTMFADKDNPDEFRKLFGEKKIIKATYNDQEVTATIDDISGSVDLMQNSLTAFNILTNMYTLDAEYIYHDFKELVVELNYFDKEDLTEAEESVMMFPIAGVSSAGWPVTRYDKGEEFYGTLLHSAEDYKAMRAETEKERNEIVQKEKAEEVEIDQPENDSEDNSSGKANRKKKTDVSNGEVTESVSSSGSGTITYESVKADSKEDKCWSKSVVNGVTFKDYKQGSGSEWADMSYWGSTMAAAGCGPTSAAIVLSGYGIDKTPVDTGNYMKGNSSPSLVAQCLENFGVEVDYSQTYGKGDAAATQCIADITEAFNEGKPVICLVGTGSDSYFTGGGHFMVLLGIDGDGTLRISNPGKLSDKQSYTSLEQFVKNYITGSGRADRGIVVPLNAPKGGEIPSENAEFAGFEGGEAVLAPVTGEVVKYGMVERTNMELVKNGVSEAEAKEKVGFIKIRVLGNTECLAGSKDDCSYFKNNKKQNGYNYFWEEYSDVHITDHVLYIEGFDVSKILSSPDSDNSVKGGNIQALSDYIKNSEDNSYSTEYEVPKFVGEDGEKRMEKLQAKEDAKEEAAYSIKRGNRIYIKEGAVIGYTYEQDKAKTIGKEVSITKSQAEADAEAKAEKEGKEKTEKTEKKKDKTKESEEDEEMVTATYQVGNYLRIIFRDMDDQVVENVENYMEIEEAEGTRKSGDAGAIEDITADSSVAEKVKAMIDYFMSQGFTLEAACGIVGNVYQESSLDANCATGRYVGLFQMDTGGSGDIRNPSSGSNWDKILTWMDNNGYNADSFAGQVRGIIECEGYLDGRSSWGSIDEMKVLTDEQDAADYWAVWVEGCWGGNAIAENESKYGPMRSSDSRAKYYQELGKRKDYATAAKEIYNGTKDSF